MGSTTRLYDPSDAIMLATADEFSGTLDLAQFKVEFAADPDDPRANIPLEGCCRLKSETCGRNQATGSMQFCAAGGVYNTVTS